MCIRDSYSSTLRVSRLGNLASFDINELPNLTALPYAKNISDFPENFQSVIQESIVKKIEMQYHDGPHNYSEEGLISYEDQMVQKMSEIEQAVLEKSKMCIRDRINSPRGEYEKENIANFFKASIISCIASRDLIF